MLILIIILAFHLSMRTFSVALPPQKPTGLSPELRISPETPSKLHRRIHISRQTCGNEDDIRRWIIRAVLAEVKLWSDLSREAIRRRPRHRADERSLINIFGNEHGTIYEHVALVYDALSYGVTSWDQGRTLLSCGSLTICGGHRQRWMLTRAEQNEIILVGHCYHPFETGCCPLQTAMVLTTTPQRTWRDLEC